MTRRSNKNPAQRQTEAAKGHPRTNGEPLMPSTRATTLPDSKFGWPIFDTPTADRLLGYCVYQSRGGYLTDYYETNPDLPWSAGLLGELQKADGAPHNSGGATTGSEQATYRRYHLGLRPLEYAASYGHATGWCCVCGVKLTGPDIAAGIHPACAQRFGATP